MYAYPHFVLATCEVNRTGECVSLKVSLIDGRYERCLEIYFDFFVGLSFTIAVALICVP